MKKFWKKHRNFILAIPVGVIVFVLIGILGGIIPNPLKKAPAPVKAPWTTIEIKITRAEKPSDLMLGGPNISCYEMKFWRKGKMSASVMTQKDLDLLVTEKILYISSVDAVSYNIPGNEMCIRWKKQSWSDWKIIEEMVNSISHQDCRIGSKIVIYYE